MTERPYRLGQFVWCAYPEWERPGVPGPLHIGYVVVVSGMPGDLAATLAYTTSQPWNGPEPPGIYSFGWLDAAAMGQKPFVLDMH